MKLIETSHGTVCSRCRLWPDLCSCDGKNEGIELLANLFGKTTRDSEFTTVNGKEKS